MRQITGYSWFWHERNNHRISCFTHNRLYSWKTRRETTKSVILYDQNKTVQPDNERHQEERKELARNWQGKIVRWKNKMETLQPLTHINKNGATRRRPKIIYIQKLKVWATKSTTPNLETININPEEEVNYVGKAVKTCTDSEILITRQLDLTVMITTNLILLVTCLISAFQIASGVSNSPRKICANFSAPWFSK